MSYTLTKIQEGADGYGEYFYKDRPDFIVAHQGMTIAETDTAIYALEAYEEMQDGKVVDISETSSYKTAKSNADLKAQIAVLEAKQTPRRLREAVKDPTWINDLDDQIAALRAQLTKE